MPRLFLAGMAVFLVGAAAGGLVTLSFLQGWNPFPPGGHMPNGDHLLFFLGQALAGLCSLVAVLVGVILAIVGLVLGWAGGRTREQEDA
jgi:hypothetical protein